MKQENGLTCLIEKIKNNSQIFKCEYKEYAKETILAKLFFFVCNF